MERMERDGSVQTGDSVSQGSVDGAPESMSEHPVHRLVEWYNQQRRALPWRETDDAYRILVSETMLQQTRVDTVIPYYHAFLRDFPTVAALAAAGEDAVVKRWQGLGYYSRARNLQAAAGIIRDRHDGQVPTDESALRALPGVGEYTVGAVMSIAFNQPVPAVDGNVLRVLSRYLGLADPIDKPSTKQGIRDVVQAWLMHAEPRAVTQALMELGALVCSARLPQCARCPVQSTCVAHGSGLTDTLPVKTPKPARRHLEVAAVWLEVDGKVLVERRPAQGLLAGMWQLPALEGNSERPVSPHAVLCKIGKDAATPALEEGQTFALIAQERHLFTHLEWVVRVYRTVGPDEPCRSLRQFGIIEPGDPFAWVPKEELDLLAWPRVYEKILFKLRQGSLLVDQP